MTATLMDDYCCLGFLELKKLKDILSKTDLFDISVLYVFVSV